VSVKTKTIVTIMKPDEKQCDNNGTFKNKHNLAQFNEEATHRLVGVHTLSKIMLNKIAISNLI